MTTLRNTNTSEDGGRNWRMIGHAQLHSDTACRPAFHPTDSNVIYASSAERLKRKANEMANGLVANQAST
jgi:hypothetical protein